MIVQKSLEEAWKLKQTRPLGVGFMEQQLASISSLNSLQGIVGHPNISAPWAVLSMSMWMLYSYWLWEVYQESDSCFPACPSHANFAILFILFVTHQTHQNHQARNTDTSDLVRTLDGRWHSRWNNMRNWKRLVFSERGVTVTFCCLWTPCILSLKNSWFPLELLFHKGMCHLWVMKFLSQVLSRLRCTPAF